MKWLFLPVIVMLFIASSPTYVRGDNSAVVINDVNQPEYDKQAVTSGFSNIPETESLTGPGIDTGRF